MVANLQEINPEFKRLLQKEFTTFNRQRQNAFRQSCISTHAAFMPETGIPNSETSATKQIPGGSGNLHDSMMLPKKLPVP